MSGATTPGGQYWDTDDFIASEPSYAQQALDEALAGLSSWVFVSPDGSFDGADPQFGYANVAVISDPAGDPADDPPAYSVAFMPAGYHIMIAAGQTPLTLVDDGAGSSLLIGNAGNDTIDGVGEHDTMIGATGANTTFWAKSTVTMVGGGNDDFAIANGYSDVTTSANGRSLVWIGGADNDVTLNGADTVACNSDNQIAYDSVVALGNANDGCLVVGPDTGELIYQCGAGPSTIVGHDGTLMAIGAAGANFVIGGFSAGSYLSYIGGSGGALVVCEASMMSVQGGSGAVTIFGGTGIGHYSAEAGPSYFVVGEGASTISAASGNTAWLTGAADVTASVTGAAIVWGVNSSGDNSFYAGNGAATIAGGMGNDLFVAGTGNATLEGGRGDDIFSFTNGEAGGTDVLLYFAPGRDVISLNGYAESAATILANETVSGGSTWLSLDDGTHIFLAGVTNLTAASFT